MKLPIMRKRKYDNWNNKTLFYTGANPVVERVLCFYGFRAIGQKVCVKTDITVDISIVMSV